jgi:hypothetical protein
MEKLQSDTTKKIKDLINEHNAETSLLKDKSSEE